MGGWDGAALLQQMGRNRYKTKGRAKCCDVGSQADGQRGLAKQDGSNQGTTHDGGMQENGIARRVGQRRGCKTGKAGQLLSGRIRDQDVFGEDGRPGEDLQKVFGGHKPSAVSLAVLSELSALSTISTTCGPRAALVVLAAAGTATETKCFVIPVPPRAS